MAIPSEFLDELRNRVTLSAIVGRTVKLQRAGREWKACCPFHNEKTPSFTLNDEKGFYHCFGCGAHGDIIRFLCDHEGLGFREAVERLSIEAGLAMPEESKASREDIAKKNSLTDVMEAAARWYHDELSGVGGADARAYIARRGLSQKTIMQFALGFAPDNRSRLKTALHSYGEEALIDTGLLIQPDDQAREPYDRFRGRLMFPIRDRRGRFIAFGGRILGDGEPKYLNSPDTPLFDKGRSLYNIDMAGPAARKAGRIIVVEGYMDVIALHQAGIEETVAPLGTALTETQLSLLWRLSDTPILCFDGDTAGQRASARAAMRALPLLKPGKSLRFLMLPPGQDPDDLIQSEGLASFERLAADARPLDERLWHTELNAMPVQTPEQKAGLQARLRDLSRSIEDGDVARAYEQAFRDRFYQHFRARPQFSKFRGSNGLGPSPFLATSSVATARRPANLIQTALMAGLLDYPHVAVSHHETLLKLDLKDQRLAQLRESVLDAVIRDPHLDKSALAHNLANAGIGTLADEVRRSNRLAFSFTRQGGDSEKAAGDLAAVLEVLAALQAVEIALGNATARFRLSAAQDDFDDQQKLRRQKDDLELRLKTLARDDE